MKSQLVILFLGVLSFVAGGCGSGKTYPATFPVSGVVTLDGAPVEGADVLLTPAGAGQGCQGVTGADGSFTVETPFDSGRVYQPGALPGEYRVSVVKLDIDPTKLAGAPPANLLPKKYADPATSGFTLTVAPEGENTIELPLKK